MKMSGSRQLAAPQDEVWAKLNDPEVLRRCIPGCESLEQTSPTDLKATVALKIGPMNVRFSGEVTLSDLNPPHSYRIGGSGKGGAAGFASGHADVKLEPSQGGTLLSYDADANVGGKLAQLGSRLINATAGKLAGQFFDNLANEVQASEALDGQGAQGAQGGQGGTGPTPGAVAGARAGTSGGIPVWLWLVGLVLAAGAAIYLFG